MEDANNLLIHHVKRQTSIHKEDKHKIKVLLKHFLMDRFKHPRQELSEDEREDDDDSGKEEASADSEPGKAGSRVERGKKKNSKDEKEESKPGKSDDPKDLDIKTEMKDGRRTPLHARDMNPVRLRTRKPIYPIELSSAPTIVFLKQLKNYAQILCIIV